MIEASTTTDREHRDLARGLDGGLEFTCLVEAGAGTGKTSVLVDRLLSIVRSGTPASRIVAITFTEKAAGELRVRFRAGLERSAGDADDSERPLLERALREIDRSTIGTIHSFCAGILRERPVEAGVDPGFAVADDLRRTVLLESSWDRWIRSELAGGLPRGAAEARSMKTELSALRELAFRLADERDVMPLVPDRVDDASVLAFVERLPSEAETLLAIADRACSDPDDLAFREIRAFAEEALALPLVPEESRVPHALTGVRVGPASNRGKKGNWEGDSLQEVRDRARSLRERQCEALDRTSHNATVAAFGWLRGFLEEYEREKTASGYVDFHDLLSRARDLVKSNLSARSYLKAAYDHILVDEFQDTDPLQCEIVFFLSEGRDSAAGEWSDVGLEPGKLFLVGDPKQSIYRFRRADIEMYEEAKEIIRCQGRLLRLSENFRTRPAVIECVNSSFEDTMVAPEGDRKYQPDYEPLVAHRPEDDAGPGFVLLRPPGGEIDEKAHADDVRRAEATAVAAWIRALLDEGRPIIFDRESGTWRPPRLGDLAILFHRTRGLEHYEDALGAYGLDYRIAGGKRFYARREVKELSAVLSAIDDPNDLVSVLAALRTPFFGVSDEDLVVHSHRTGGLRYLAPPGEGVPSVERAFGIMRDLHFLRNSRSVSELLMTLFDRTSALELYLLKPSGEQRHANLIKVVELASALEKQEPMSFAGFVRWLGDVSRLTPEEAESPMAEEGDQFVRALTIHKSKGLEFPITILADLGRHRYRGDGLIVDREEARVEYSRGSGGGRLRTLGYEEESALEKERALAETIRLLYVGATRARDLVVVPWFPDGGKSTSGLLPHLESLAARASAEGDPVARWYDTARLDLSVRETKPVRLDLDQALSAEPGETRAARALAEWSERMERFAPEHDRPPAIVTPSRLGHAGRGAPVGPRGERPLPDSGLGHVGSGPPAEPSGSTKSRHVEHGSFPDDERENLYRVGGTALGLLVHSVMEQAALGESRGLEDVVRAVARSEGATAELEALAARMAVRAMGSPVVRRAVASGRFAREAPFCARLDGFTIEGKMDLLFVEEAGLTIVDYKTDQKPAGGFEALAETYGEQALAYCVAAEKATGLPVREVVLLFLSEEPPVEIVVPLPAGREERERELVALAARPDARLPESGRT
ncbi:MAG: AAA family ATPase [Candidatus Eisenbacteria bacterium]|nr:AAA family ATPase [Candidatus Eisenbacteria bacterium]